MKIRAVGARLFHAGSRADKQAYMTQLMVAFRYCANVPKNISINQPLPPSTGKNRAKFQQLIGHTNQMYVFRFL
jgi:hypothetical protein